MNPPLRHLGFATALFCQAVALWAMWYLPWRFDVQQLREGREWLSAVVFGFLIAQASLVGLWSAIGPARLPLRAISSLLALVALYIASYSFYFRFEESTSLDLALLLAFCILLA